MDCPIAFEITPGQLGDALVALALKAAAPASARLTADAAYNSNGVREFLIERVTELVINNNPHASTHTL